MASGIYLAIWKEEKGHDITNLVKKIVWKGRKGSASRSITATLIDDDGYNHDRTSIDVIKGYQCVFKYDGQELFRGIIMSTRQTDRKEEVFTAYDIGIYLANNRDTFAFKKKTADAIFKFVCKRFKIPYAKPVKCEHVIKELTKGKTTGFDVICDAMNQEYEATGIRHYVLSEKGKLKLLTRRENIVQWVIEEGVNIESYTYTKSIEDIKTRIKMSSDKGKILAVAKDKSLEKKIGIFQEVQTPDDSMSKAQMKKLVKSVLKEEKKPERRLEIEALGIPSVISGRGVYIIIGALGLKRTFYVDQDTHTFEGNKHTMSLTLTYTNDLSN